MMVVADKLDGGTAWIPAFAPDHAAEILRRLEEQKSPPATVRVFAELDRDEIDALAETCKVPAFGFAARALNPSQSV